MIQLNTHKVHDEAIHNVVNVLRSGWTGLGSVVAEFEKAVSEYLDTPYVIGLNSGTAAILLALHFIRDSNKGAYVITTPNTFISTNHSILQSGFLPVFADIEPDTGNISMESIQRLLEDKFIRSRTRAIVVVHYAGQPVDMDTLYDISNNYNIDIVEDAAHAFGAAYNNDKIGCKYSRLVAFSLHAVKPLAVGEGGLLATYDREIDSVSRKLRWCGIDKTTKDRTDSKRYTWDYNVEFVGHKWHMSNVAAAIGLGQLIHFDDDASYRQKLVDLYRSELSTCPHIELLAQRPNRKSSNHLFVIKCERVDDKNDLMNYLNEYNIQTGCHYRPSHLYRLYATYETDNGCRNAVDFFQRAISLPLHLNLVEEDVVYVCEKVKKFFKERK